MKENNPFGGSIYTLAQNGTDNFLFEVQNRLIGGIGTSIIKNPALLKRANKKVIANALTLALVDIAKSNGEFDLVQGYWNTFHCQNELISYNNRVYGKYCKNRWCPTCCGIRKANILNQYHSILSEWEEPHLLTLTIKSIKAEYLDRRINEMISKFDTIKDRCNKRNRRGKGMKITGIKSLECNFNATKKWYNPHYHLIVPNRQTALYLKQEWRKEWNKNGLHQASEYAQDIRKIMRVEEGLIEVIKYGVKMLTDPDPNNKRKRKKGDLNNLKIYANALHVIYKGMRNHRLFGSFGFKLPKKKTNNSNQRWINEFDIWKYRLDKMDWINTRTEKCLTEYEIDAQLEALLKSCIDIELH